MKKSSIFLYIILFNTTVVAQKSPILLQHYANEMKSFKEFTELNKVIKGDTTIDVKFYYLDLNIEIDYPYIEGKVSCIFEPLTDLNTIKLELNSALTVDSVNLSATSFEHIEDNLLITLDNFYEPGQDIELVIFYHGVPALANGYKGLRYETHGENEQNEPIIATLSTPYLAHYWYPCKDGPEDKPDSVYVDITIADTSIMGIDVIAVSNGILENTIDNGTTKTFQWRHRYPIVTYYVMMAISNYVHFQQDYLGSNGDSFSLDYYVFDDDFEISQIGVEDIPEVMDFFSETFGAYPFNTEKYGMTQLGYYGAIENQTNTIINQMSPAWFYVSVHELGHMWFGDMITCSDWHHGWLNEGFASYSEALWDEHKYGYEAYKDNMAANEYWNGGTLFLQNAQDTFNTFPNIIYQKGAYALHMLRGVMGDELFFDFLLDYAQNPDFVYGNANTEDMQLVAETTSGMDLDFFFEQWVYDEYYPIYNYNYVQDSDNKVTIIIKQVQEDSLNARPVFEMPVQLKFNFPGGGDTLIAVWNDEQFQVFEFSLTEEITSLEIDPDKWILNEQIFDPNLPVNLSEIIIANDIQIFPNPVKDYLHISNVMNTENALIEIYNMNGEKIHIKGEQRSNISSINCRRFSTGNYLIKITTGSLIVFRKFIKI